ncbi:MAG: glycerate kinase [Frankia sp.]
MRLVAAPDKFRGTLSAPAAAAAIAQAAEAAGWAADRRPLADGGEGTLDAFGGANRSSLVVGPVGDPVRASWRLAGSTAVVETALASGLLLAGGAAGNDPMRATSRGTGELIAEAIDAGAREVVVGVGGSAMTDGGAGAVAVLDPYGPLDGSRGWRVTVACDVRTPFVRAATDFGPQKGASPDQVEQLVRRLDGLAAHYRARYGRDVRELPGAGAAGGLGGALAALGARLVPGAPLLADQVGLAVRLAGADLVVTGEGRLDATSFDGKVVGTVAAMAREYGVSVLVVVGAAVRDADGPARGLEVVSLSERFGERRSFAEPAACLAAVVAEHLT